MASSSPGFSGGAAHPGSGPRASTTLILAAMVAVLAADPALAPSATQGPELIIAIAGATVVLAGIAQIVLGAVGAGSSARFVPYPFVAGFMCGVSALIIIAQVAPLAGFTRADLAAGAGGRLAGAAAGDAARRPRHRRDDLGDRREGEARAGAAARAPRGHGCSTTRSRSRFPAARLGPVLGTAPYWLPVPTALGRWRARRGTRSLRTSASSCRPRA